MTKNCIGNKAGSSGVLRGIIRPIVSLSGLPLPMRRTRSDKSDPTFLQPIPGVPNRSLYTGIIKVGIKIQVGYNDIFVGILQFYISFLTGSSVVLCF